MALANNGLVTRGKATTRMTGIKEGKGSRGGYEAEEVEGVMKQRNLTDDNALNWPTMVSEKHELVDC